MILPLNQHNAAFAAQRSTAGGAQPGVSEALYASPTPSTVLPYTTVAKAPARGGGRALRGGAPRRALLVRIKPNRCLCRLVTQIYLTNPSFY